MSCLKDIWSSIKTLRLKLKAKRWFFIACCLLFVLWGGLFDFYFFNNSISKTLPTEETFFNLSNDGVIGILFLRGQVFEDKIIQNDILECKISLYAVSATKFENESLGLYVITYDPLEHNNFDELSQGELENNREFYEVFLKRENFNDRNEATFFIKVPPVDKFTILLDVPGYYAALESHDHWKSTTKLQDYIQETLPNLQILALLFSVFGTVNYARQLWQNK